MPDKKERLIFYILRVSLAFVFAYAAVRGFMDPYSWIGYFPGFLRSAIPGLILLKIWGVFEIVLALWLLFGKNIYVPSVLAALSLAGLILTNLPEMDILFRDIPIIAIAVVLAMKSQPPFIVTTPPPWKTDKQ